MKNRKMMSLMLVVVMVMQFVVAANVFAAPAPGIGSYKIAYVGSTLGGFWEYIYPGQYLTAKDHGGTELYVVTEQAGYDAYTVAKMNGVACSLALTEYFYSPYPTVSGFRYYWNCSGQQQGQFTATAYSVNTYTPWSVWINVK